MAVGFSLGANILVKYLSEEMDNTPLFAAVSVANPFDFVMSADVYKIFLEFSLRIRCLQRGWCIRSCIIKYMCQSWLII